MKAEATRRPALAGMRQRVAHEVDAASLPAGVEHLGYGCLDAFAGVGDDQLDAAAARQSGWEPATIRMRMRRCRGDEGRA